MASTTKAVKGFNVTCPHCHSTDDTVTIDLNDLAECRCAGCDETFSAVIVRDLMAAELAQWEKVVRWVEMGRALAAE